MYPDNPLNNLRVIIVVRGSTAEQTEQTIQKQLALCKGHTERCQMVVVDSLVLDDTSATNNEHEPYLRALIERKEQDDDFDGLLFTDFSRFARRVEEGRQLLSDLGRAGIKVVTIKEGLIEGKWAWLQTGLHISESQAYAESLAFNTSTGFTRAVQLGKIPPCLTPTYGIDKLYVQDGQDVFILRDLADGRKVKLHPTTGEPLEYIIKKPHQRSVVKQPNQIIKLVKGAPESVKVVEQIMRRHFIDGWGIDLPPFSGPPAMRVEGELPSCAAAPRA